jgi:hypothetical protein
VPASRGRSRVVVRAPAPGCFGDPVWSPTGASIGFTSTCLDEVSEDAPAVYDVHRDGSHLRQWFDPAVLASANPGSEVYVGRALAWQARP